jgi:hypothetical protein
MPALLPDFAHILARYFVHGVLYLYSSLLPLGITHFAILHHTNTTPSGKMPYFSLIFALV